jgi:hypothetical protein
MLTLRQERCNILHFGDCYAGVNQDSQSSMISVFLATAAVGRITSWSFPTCDFLIAQAGVLGVERLV